MLLVCFVFQAILEVELISHGFTDVKQVANKLSCLLDGLRKSLPKRPFYDFGLDFLMSVINMASKVMKQDRECNELDCIMLEVKKYIMDKIHRDDFIIVSELFSVFEMKSTSITMKIDGIRDGLENLMKSKQLKYDEGYLKSLASVHNSIKQNPVTTVIGSPGSGKITAIQVLKDFRESHMISRNCLAIEVILEDPNLMNQETFYGNGEKPSYLHTIVNNAIKNKNKEIWVIFKSRCGSLDWLEMFYHHMNVEKNTFYFLMPELLPVPPNLKIIILISNYKPYNSLTFLSQLNTVMFNHSVDFLSHHFQEWEESLTLHVKQFFSTLIDKSLLQILNKLESTNSCMNRSILLKMAHVFTTLISSQLKSLDIEYELLEEKELSQIYYIAFKWSFGGLPFDIIQKEVDNLCHQYQYDFKEQLEPYIPHEVMSNIARVTEESGVIITNKLASTLYILIMLLKNQIPVILKGGMGSGKSVILFLLFKMLNEDNDCITISLSSITEPLDILSEVRKKLFRNGERLYQGQKSQLYLFLDDVQCMNLKKLSVVVNSLSINKRQKENAQWHHTELR